MKLPTLIYNVESHQRSVHNPVSVLQIDCIGPSLQEHDSIREGPSGEERTPGRSGPLELCSTE
ncbi:MAG TPA: hypothetical protein VFX10_00395, partial [Nitrospira sp.]|nr:hypothetical protein [Nitrospira sp.]